MYWTPRGRSVGDLREVLERKRAEKEGRNEPDGRTKRGPPPDPPTMLNDPLRGDDNEEQEPRRGPCTTEFTASDRGNRGSPRRRSRMAQPYHSNARQTRPQPANIFVEYSTETGERKCTIEETETYRGRRSERRGRGHFRRNKYDAENQRGRRFLPRDREQSSHQYGVENSNDSDWGDTDNKKQAEPAVRRHNDDIYRQERRRFQSGGEHRRAMRFVRGERGRSFGHRKNNREEDKSESDWDHKERQSAKKQEVGDGVGGRFRDQSRNCTNKEIAQSDDWGQSCAHSNPTPDESGPSRCSDHKKLNDGDQGGVNKNQAHRPERNTKKKTEASLKCDEQSLDDAWARARMGHERGKRFFRGGRGQYRHVEHAKLKQDQYDDKNEPELREARTENLDDKQQFNNKNETSNNSKELLGVDSGAVENKAAIKQSNIKEKQQTVDEQRNSTRQHQNLEAYNEESGKECKGEEKQEECKTNLKECKGDIQPNQTCKQDTNKKDQSDVDEEEPTKLPEEPTDSQQNIDDVQNAPEHKKEYLNCNKEVKGNKNEEKVEECKNKFKEHNEDSQTEHNSQTDDNKEATKRQIETTECEILEESDEERLNKCEDEQINEDNGEPEDHNDKQQKPPSNTAKHEELNKFTEESQKEDHMIEGQSKQPNQLSLELRNVDEQKPNEPPNDTKNIAQQQQQGCVEQPENEENQQPDDSEKHEDDIDDEEYYDDEEYDDEEYSDDEDYCEDGEYDEDEEFNEKDNNQRSKCEENEKYGERPAKEDEPEEECEKENQNCDRTAEKEERESGANNDLIETSGSCDQMKVKSNKNSPDS